MAAGILLREILTILDGIAAFTLAESWDNVGLLVGDPEQEVSGILVALDPTEDLLDEAIASGANTIITHHPLIFKPLKAVRTDESIGRFLCKALNNRMAVIGCHTNLDVVAGGVSDVLARDLGMIDIMPLVTGKEIRGLEATAGDSIGFGRIGKLKEAIPAAVFFDQLLEVLKIPAANIAGKFPEKINRFAVCGGSGSDLAETAFSSGAQVFITGEVKHSVARWAEANGHCVIDAGHFATENIVVPVIAATLKKQLEANSIRISVKVASDQKGPFQLYLKNSH
ncbi:MAG: Nif3-like dinuclear metal center hexameric protein [Proteobacteria bacterium]|nr:Nif3-like dinuclear metal center hexameric protein [Pseudomonadota bacterium]MBU1711392.1 Nif3-like dinuclear metal center hexameric protein [Pseudomonadota bacterium]